MTTDPRSLFTTALQNTHALEQQALQIMQRQVERLQHYPDMKAALESHIAETHVQRDRLEAALDSVGARPSSLKEGFLGFVGNMMALGHTPAQDEILKNAFANQAFENFEIAAYTSLIAMGEQLGQTAHLDALRTSLAEEEAMAKTVARLVPQTTRTYVDLTLGGSKADR